MDRVRNYTFGHSSDSAWHLGADPKMYLNLDASEFMLKNLHDRC